MSYKPVENEDSLSELFSKVNDSKIIETKMIESKNNFNDFTLWFDKALKISPRNVKIFVRNNYKIFNPEIQKYLDSSIKNRKSGKEFYK